MTALRQKLTDELDLRGFSPLSRQLYINAVHRLARHFHKPPDQLSNDQLKAYLLHLLRERHHAPSTMMVTVSALRFFYRHVAPRCLAEVEAALPRRRSRTIRPRVYSLEEMERLLSAEDLNRKHRVLLMTTYAAGLRVSEVCRLKVSDIVSARMQIRVEQGKGAKDRYTLLSPKLLEQLRAYWRVHRPPLWLFPSKMAPDQPITPRTAQRVFQVAVHRAGLPDYGGIHSLRHSFATHLLEAGVDVVVLQRLLGHANLATSARYLHVRQERLAQLKSPLDLIEFHSFLQPPAP